MTTPARLLQGLLAATFLLSLVACGGSGSPTSPSGPPASSGGGATTGACRTYATSSTTARTSGGTTSTTTSSCSFNTGAAELTCVVSGTATATRYASVADFVDEVRVVPPLPRWATVTTGPAGQAFVLTNTFDGNRRLTSTTSTAPNGAATVTQFTAWDASGRPTESSTVLASGTSRTITTYDDATRTQVTITSGPAGSSTTTSVYDASGHVISQSTAGGTAPSVSTTVTATAQVCR